MAGIDPGLLRRPADVYKDKTNSLKNKIEAELASQKANSVKDKVLNASIPTYAGTKLIACKESTCLKLTQYDLLKQWQAYRRSGNIQAGCILATYANIYLPIKNGEPKDEMYRAFSLQGYDFLCGSVVASDRNFVIYDYPLFEEDYSVSPLNPFLFLSPEAFIKTGDYYSFNTWHVGLLSQAALSKIVEATNGRGWLVDALIDTEGLVFYKPEDFVWYNVGSWSELAENEKRTRQRPLWAAAAAAVIDMV